MSELRIRSEAFEEIWAQPFLPPQAHLPGGFDDGDDGDFGPLLVAGARALTQLFGLPVSVVPGRPPKPEGGEPPPRIAAILASLLATLQLGGDPARAGDGVQAVRQARQIAEALDAAAVRAWPAISHSPGFDLEISCAGLTGHAHVPAPPRPPAPPPQPVAALASRVFDMPMRLRVELASELTPVAVLLPLRAGTVLPIAPTREMPLILGDHCIGHATIAPLPDGRQQATIVEIGVSALDGGFR
jgi:flagellar motor switch/type III secretory pathway protein FliN